MPVEARGATQSAATHKECQKHLHLGRETLIGFQYSESEGTRKNFDPRFASINYKKEYCILFTMPFPPQLLSRQDGMEALSEIKQLVIG